MRTGGLSLMLTLAAHSLRNDKGAQSGQGKRLCQISVCERSSISVDANAPALSMSTLIPGDSASGPFVALVVR